MSKRNSTQRFGKVKLAVRRTGSGMPLVWGHGLMGAATALEAAVQCPDELAGLILVLPPTAWDTRPRQAA